MYEDNVPFEVVDLEVGDVSDQIGGDVIEAHSKVRFSIKKAELRYSKDRTVASLNLQAQVGALGVDGQGKYANKVIFGELIVWSDPETKVSDWWKKQAKFPFKTFLTALGLDPKSPPRINDEFLTGLKGQEFIADIRKVDIQSKDETGKYVNTGDFKNTLVNYKKAE